MSEFSERLSAAQKLWKEGKDTPPGIPEGQYLMQLQDAKLAESSTGKLMVKREHFVVEGERAGETVYDVLVIEGERGPYMLASWIRMLGFEPPEDLSTLEDLFAQIVAAAPCCLVRAKRSGDFTNLTILELVAAPEAGEAEEAPAAAPAKAPVGLKGAFSLGQAVSFEDDDKNVVTGKVIKVGPAGFNVQDDADGGVWEDIPAQVLSAVAAAAPAKPKRKAPAQPEPEPEPEGGLAEGSRVSIAFQEGPEEGVVKSIVGDKVTVTLDAGDDVEVGPDDCTVLASAAAEGNDEDEETENLRVAALALAQAKDIECDEDDDIASLAEKLGTVEWVESEVLPDEVEVLTALGIEVKPKPAKKPVTRKPAAAPAKPARKVKK